MPPDKNCIPLINIIHSTLPMVRKNLFPIRLEHLFPVMYPGHEYVGLNHAALIDCRQTRLVCEGVEQLGGQSKSEMGSGGQEISQNPRKGPSLTRQRRQMMSRTVCFPYF
jgi:hypothetical protein